MDYQIVHAITGRLRLKLSLLGTDAVFAGKLLQKIEAIPAVTEARINAQAQSIIITYRYKKISQAALLETIEAAIVECTPPPEVSEEPESELSADVPQSPIQKAEVSSKDQSTASNSPTVESAAAEPEAIELTTIEPKAAEPAAVEPEVIKLKTAEPAEDIAQQTVLEPTVLEPTVLEPTVLEPTVLEPTFDPATINVEEDLWAEPSPILVTDSLSAAPEENLQAIAPRLPEFLSPKALAARLGITPQALTRYRSKPDFNEWCRTRDPGGVVWQYDQDSKQFSPVSSELINPAVEIDSVKTSGNSNRTKSSRKKAKSDRR